jgi:hypothetical protein
LKKSLVPHSPQKLRTTPGDDACVASESRPATISTCDDGKPAHVTNAAPCARRQLSQ